MSKQNAPTWAYSLPSTLVLMVPFDLLASLAMDVYLPVVPEMPDALGTSSSIVQLTLSLYLLVLGLGQLVFGPVSDRIGRRPVVLGGAALFAIASFLLAMAGSGAVFLVLRVVQALGASAALVATFATVRDVYGDRPESATIYGLFSAVLAFVPAVGPILGAIVALALGWRAIFSMLGVLAGLALLHATLRWHETRPDDTSPSGPAVSLILRSRGFWLYTFGFGTAMGAFFVFLSSAPRVLVERAGWSQVSLGLAFSSVALVMIGTTRCIGTFAEKWGTAGAFIRGACIMAGGALVLGVLSALAPAGFIGFVMPMWLIAVGIVFMVAVTANGALGAFKDAAGTAVALYYGIQSVIVSGLGTLFVLVLDGSTARPLVAYCLVMSTACLAGCAILRPK